MQRIEMEGGKLNTAARISLDASSLSFFLPPAPLHLSARGINETEKSIRRVVRRVIFRKEDRSS